MLLQVVGYQLWAQLGSNQGPPDYEWDIGMFLCLYCFVLVFITIHLRFQVCTGFHWFSYESGRKSGRFFSLLKLYNCCQRPWVCHRGDLQREVSPQKRLHSETPLVPRGFLEMNYSYLKIRNLFWVKLQPCGIPVVMRRFSWRSQCLAHFRPQGVNHTSDDRTSWNRAITEEMSANPRLSGQVDPMSDD